MGCKSPWSSSAPPPGEDAVLMVALRKTRYQDSDKARAISCTFALISSDPRAEFNTSAYVSGTLDMSVTAGRDSWAERCTDQPHERGLVFVDGDLENRRAGTWLRYVSNITTLNVKKAVRRAFAAHAQVESQVLRSRTISRCARPSACCNWQMLRAITAELSPLSIVRRFSPSSQEPSSRVR